MGEEHVQVLNSVAKSIIERRQALRPVTHTEGCASQGGGQCNCTMTYVFGYKGVRLAKLHTTAWKKAWKKAGLPTGPE